MSEEVKYLNNSDLCDAWIHGMVEAVLMLNSRLNKYSFKIDVLSKNVTVQGEVHSVVDEWLCLELLKGLKPINNINMHLKVVELELLPHPADVVTSRTVYFHWYNDANTTAEVKTKLAWNKSLSGKHIQVSTKNGVVTLSGEVDYVANKAIAERVASQLIQVNAIENNIVVNG